MGLNSVTGNEVSYRAMSKEMGLRSGIRMLSWVLG